MRPSLARYLIFKLIPIIVVVNIVMNTLAGLVSYPVGAPMPLRGLRSVGLDTIGAAFITAFLTYITSLPGARREVWAGRVRGLDRGIGWFGKRPITSSIIVGVIAVDVTAIPAILAFDHLNMSTVPYSTFMLFKPAFATVLALFVGVPTAVYAAQAEPDVSSKSDWKPPPEGLSYPLGYFDKGALSVSDDSKGCSGTPTWDLIASGALDPAHVRIALADAVTRYPSLATKVHGVDGIPPWAAHYRYVVDATFKIEDIFRVVQDPDIDAMLREERNRPLDPFKDYPVTLTLAITSDDSCHLIFRQHHMIADGRAFIGMLEDFARFLELARNGSRPTVDQLAPIHRRGDLEPLGLSAGKRAIETARGLAWLFGKFVRNKLSPPTLLVQNRSRDYLGQNGTIYWTLPDTVLGGWNAARKRMGVSLNSMLTGALFIANARWHKAMNEPAGRAVTTLMVETRPRDGSFISFANHLAMHEVSLQLDQVSDPIEAAKAVQAEVESQRKANVPVRRLLAERIGVLPMPLGDMRSIIFDAKRLTSNLDFSNLIALKFPTLEGNGWRVEEVHITTTVAPRTGIIVTVIRYNGQITFNFNYKSSAATREQTRAMADHLVAVLAELAGPLPESRWT